MYYPTRICTPSSSTSFFMFFLRYLLLQYQFRSTINKDVDTVFTRIYKHRLLCENMVHFEITEKFLFHLEAHARTGNLRDSFQVCA